MVTDATLRHDIFEEVYDIINAISFSVASVSVKGVFQDNVEQMPQVVIYSPEVEEDTFSFGGWTNTSKTINVVVEVYTTKNKDKDVILDEVVNGVKSNKFTGANLMKIDQGVGFVVENNNKIHTGNITFTFKRS